MRRRTVLAAGLAVLLAGCGQSGDSGAPAVALAIDHQYGSTQLSGTPKRVVTMTGSWTDALIALKVPILAEATKLITSATGMKQLQAVKTVAKGNMRVVVSAERADLLAAGFVLMWPLTSLA